MRKLHWAILLAMAAAGLLAARPATSHRPPSRVFNSAAEPGTLQEKVDRVLAEAPKSAPEKSFWIGYSIGRLQGENSHIGSYFVGAKSRDLTVADVLAGKNAAALPDAGAGDVRDAAASALDRIENKGKPEKKVLKELGFFLKYGPGRPTALAAVGMSNLHLTFDFEGLPLYWIGKAEEDQSLGLVRALYGRTSGEKIREDLIAAAGCHGTPKLVLPFLEHILTGDGPDGLREDAAFWIGQQNDAESLRLLVRAARSDRSQDVREGAVFSISEIELPAAVDELITLARNAELRDVRKQAVFWLGQMASEKSGQVLEEIARGDYDVEIQEQAVFALSELPGDQGLEALIKLAKTHPDPRIRKKAVFWLGESDDPRALEAIIAIIKGK